MAFKAAVDLARAVREWGFAGADMPTAERAFQAVPWTVADRGNLILIAEALEPVADAASICRAKALLAYNEARTDAVTEALPVFVAREERRHGPMGPLERQCLKSVLNRRIMILYPDPPFPRYVAESRWRGVVELPRIDRLGRLLTRYSLRFLHRYFVGDEEERGVLAKYLRKRPKGVTA